MLEGHFAAVRELAGRGPNIAPRDYVALAVSRLEDAPPGSRLVYLLGGLSEHALDAKGRTEVGLEHYGYRWLRLLRPQDDPII